VWQLAAQLKPPPALLTVLLAPLWIQGQVIGSLEVVWEEGYSITTQEEQFLEAVAVQVALAITNARLYQEKERAPQEAREQAKQLANRAAEVDEWKQRYEAAIKATGQVLYDWDFQSNAVIWGGQSEDVLGILQPRCPIP